MKKRDIVKTGAKVVVGCGLYCIVDGAVSRMTRDPFAGLCKKIAIGSASLVLQGMLYDKASEWTDMKIDKIMDEVEKKMSEEEK